MVEFLNAWGARFAGFALPMFMQSALLIALLFALDLALRKRVRATIRYAAWMLALVKLALPPSLASPTGAAYWLPAETAQRFSVAAPPQAAVPEQFVVNPSDKPASGIRGIARSDSGSAGLSWQADCFVVWLAVALGMGIWVVWRLRVVVVVLRQSAEAPEEVRTLLESCRRQLGINRVIPVRCAAIGSPAICGVFRPMILLPPALAENLGGSEMRSVLLHELAHYKRGDLWVNHAQILLQILYWYNPLLWLANASIRRAREQAVDEMVLVEMGEEAEAYPSTLLRVAKLGLGRPLAAVGLMGILEPGRGLTRRILHIMSQPLPRTARIGARGLVAVVLLALVAVPMACRRKTEPPPQPPPQPPVSASSQPRADAAKSPMPVPGELKFVTTASLASCVSNGNAVFHFKGRVDGSDNILITHDGAQWTHARRHWPLEPVVVNNTSWNPMEKSYLTALGPERFLPATFSLESVDLEVIEGRDVVAIERTNQGLMVYLDDTPGGAGEYDFKINFHPAGLKPADAGKSPVARLKVAAQVSGSDCIKITATEAVLEHKTYLLPSDVRVNGLPWDVARTSVLKNEGATRFLPDGVDFSTARIIKRQGRDLATAWGEKDALWVHFADNPNGSSPYEIEIAFGPE
jgi:beta-lactamase regulating signal transducer with metallopeptidase domain